MPRDPSISQTRIIGCVGSAIAILVTLFRLSIRIRYRKLWWDDASAFLAMVAIIIFMTGIILFTDPPHAHPRPVKIAAYYMVDNGFYGVIWSARASILLTLVRLSYGRIRIVLKCWVAAVFVTWSVLFAQVFWTCENEPGWKDAVIAQCMLGKQVAIAQLITDCLFDLVLVASPIYLLRDMRNKHGLKIRLLAVFSSTIFTTAFSLAHAWAIIEDRGLMEFALAGVEVFTSLIVVNLTVIVSWLFRINDDQTTEPYPRQVNTYLRGRLSGGQKTRSQNRQHTTTFNPASTFAVPMDIRPPVKSVVIEVETDVYAEREYDVELKVREGGYDEDSPKRPTGSDIHLPPRP